MSAARRTPRVSRSRTPGATGAAAADLLLEIGTEELPFQFIAPAQRALEAAAKTLLEAQRLSFGEIRTFATPRRLALSVQRLAARQTPALKEAMGPPKSAAFDAAGQPTKAALGFAASQGVAVSALEVRHLPRGEYLFAVKRDEGHSTPMVLNEQLASLIAGLSFPKAMKWNESGFRFARPLRWIVGLYGSQTLRFEVGGVRAGNRTFGHRVLGGSKAVQGIVLSGAAAYQQTLERLGVIVDPVRRRDQIEHQLNALAQERGQWRADEGLLEQAVYAVECPTTVLGSFDEKFLTLPADIIETAMKEHQGFFALRNAQGSLLPRFLAVTNIKCADMSQIRKGNERVLAARLSDAAFYYSEDRKTSLADRAEKLGTVIFHQKLGTMGQKTQRMVELAGWLAEALHQPALAVDARRAALLCKADLLAGVVGEFPALQGVMGGLYAEQQGESPGVAHAIRDQYTPRGMEGKLPETLVGKVVSLADRLDTIGAFFAAGVTPKGSEDPFALRRHALSIVRIVVEGNVRLDLREALRRATDAVRPHLKQAAKGADDPVPFVVERFRFYVGAGDRFRSDIVEAVASGLGERGPVDFIDALARIQALQAIAGRPEFDPLIVGFKRAHRLVQKEQWTQEVVDPNAFQHQAEQELYAALQDAKPRVLDSLSQHRYPEALNELVGLKAQIDAFFDGVMVNAQDQRLRANRLSLLCVIDALFLRVANFSLVAEQGSGG